MQTRLWEPKNLKTKPFRLEKIFQTQNQMFGQNKTFLRTLLSNPVCAQTNKNRPSEIATPHQRSKSIILFIFPSSDAPK